MYTYVIVPRDPPSVVMGRIDDFGAVGIDTDIVGATKVTIRISALNSAKLEVGGTAVSALVWRDTLRNS